MFLSGLHGPTYLTSETMSAQNLPSVLVTYETQYNRPENSTQFRNSSLQFRWIVKQHRLVSLWITLFGKQIFKIIFQILPNFHPLIHSMTPEARLSVEMFDFDSYYVHLIL